MRGHLREGHGAGTFADAMQMNLTLYSTVRCALMGLDEDESDNVKVFMYDGGHYA